jgi:hypothetical protein
MISELVSGSTPAWHAACTNRCGVPHEGDKVGPTRAFGSVQEACCCTSPRPRSTPQAVGTHACELRGPVRPASVQRLAIA